MCTSNALNTTPLNVVYSTSHIVVAGLDPLGNEDESSSSSTLWYYGCKGCIYNKQRLTSTACAHARRVLPVRASKLPFETLSGTHGNLALGSSKLECSGRRRRGRVDDLDKIVFKLAPRALESRAYQALRSIVKEPPSEGVTLHRFRFSPAFEWTAAQDPQDVVALPVRPVLQCRYSLMCPLACANIVYMNMLMSSSHVARCCTQLAHERNLSTLNAPHL